MWTPEAAEIWIAYDRMQMEQCEVPGAMLLSV